MPKRFKLDYDSEAMKDIINRDWFKRVWTIQEVVMAREPIVVCGKKSISWSNLHWGIWSAKSLADNGEDGGPLSEVFDSVLVAQSLWLDHYIISEWSEAPIKRWLLCEKSPESTTVRKHVIQFMSDRGWTLAYLQMAAICLTIFVRMSYGLRPLDSLGLLLLVLSAIATVLLTPTRVFKDHEWKVRGTIVNILNRTRTRQATKQVDRVFALYGVFQKLGIPLQKPDYGKSLGEVYCEFTRTIINWQNSLDILTEASTPALPKTPSWVPDWSTRYYPIFKGHPSAAKNSPARYFFSDCCQKLQTSGILVDMVTYAAELLEESRDDIFNIDRSIIDSAFLTRSLHNVDVLMEWISYALQMSKRSNELFLEALFKTIHSETDFETKDKSNLNQFFGEWYAFLTADYSKCRQICPPKIACALAMSANESLNRYHHDRCRAIANRRILFVTSKGYVGTGPPSTRVTDKVVILSGLRSPLILREVGPHYEVVGAAYVHGIMYGEVWPEDESKLLGMTLI
jgi:hypothetical protein